MDIEKSINLSDNLRVWMLAGKMKQAELAEYLGMVPGMMSQRLMGVKEWRDEDVERISKLMNVSEEKLMQPNALGETLRRFEKSRKNPSYRKNFGGRLNRLAGKKGKTIRELSAELGMEYSGICKWVMGTGLPSAFALVKIANYFGLTAAQLAGFEPEAARPEPEAAKPEPEAAEPEPETAETEQEEEKTEPETAEPEEEKTGKCRTVDERREMFRDRLRELIERSGKTAEETARDTEIGLPLLQGYLEGKYFPGYLMAQKLAEYFDVSTEVLSGEAEMPERNEMPKRNEMPERNEKMVGDYQRFAERLSELIRRTGKGAGNVGYEIGIGLPLWGLYLGGQAMPSIKMAGRIAKYFGVSVAVLLGDEELPEEECGEHDDEEVPTEERYAARAAAEGNYTLAADIIIGRAEKVKLTELDVDKVINGLAREVAEYDAYHAWVAGEESVHCPGAILVAIAALRKLRPARIGVLEPGRGKCPVCGEIVSKDCPMCPHCLQRLSWELGCGDEELPEPENEAEDCWLPAVQYSEDDKRRREGKEIVSRAERISLKSVNFPEVIETISLFLANIRDICEYEPERDAIMAGLAALIRAAPQKVIVDEGGNARCPVCGLGVEHGEEMCKRCCQLLDWEIIEVGDEVYMSGDWSVRFWVGGKEENGFIWGYDMSFQRCCEHPADLVRSGRNCPELARGLEAAARIGQQEGENERV